MTTDTHAICRMCKHPATPDEECPANTPGCSDWCGFFCGCDGAGWNCGPHVPDPDRPLFTATTNRWGGPSYVLTSGERSFEWTAPGGGVILHLDHTPAGAGDPDAVTCCRVTAGACTPTTRPLRGAAWAAFITGDPATVERAMRSRWDHGAGGETNDV